jgi:hypothetical protein
MGWTSAYQIKSESKQGFKFEICNLQTFAKLNPALNQLCMCMCTYTNLVSTWRSAEQLICSLYAAYMQLIYMYKHRSQFHLLASFLRYWCRDPSKIFKIFRTSLSLSAILEISQSCSAQWFQICHLTSLQPFKTSYFYAEIESIPPSGELPDVAIFDIAL